MNKKVYIEPKQSLFDVALQEFGSVEGLFDLIGSDGSIGSVNQNLSAGKKIEFEKPPKNEIVVDYFKSNGLEVNCGLIDRAYSSGFSFGFR